MGTKWFSDVNYYLDESPPKSGKYTLIFALKEMTLLTKVEFRGRKAIRLKEIEDTTGLKAGNRADPSQTWLAVSQIQELYREKGYDLASVTLARRGQPRRHQDRDRDLRGAQGQGDVDQLRGQPFRFGRNVANSYRHSKTDSGPLRQVSRRDARGRPAEARSTITMPTASSRRK